MEDKTDKTLQGIAFIGGDCPNPEKCAILAKNAAIIVAADSGLIIAEKAGVKVDLIVGDMDSIDDIKRLEKYSKKQILRYPRDKDYTDTELALNLLYEKNCNETILIGGGGGRTDHLLAIYTLFERNRSPDHWHTENEDIYCIKDGKTISLTTPKESIISVFPLGETPWNAKSTGLKWELNDIKWKRGFFGISNIAVNGTFTVTSNSGRFLLIVQITGVNS